MNTLTTWLGRAVDLVYPRNCQFCEIALDETERGVICGLCLGKVKFIAPPRCERCSLPFTGALPDRFECGYCRDKEFAFDRAVCACRNEDLVLDAIHRFKYGQQMYFARHLTDWLTGMTRRQVDWSQVDAIVPVPLHPRKKRHRGFNQAEVLADALGQAFHVRVQRRALRRVKDTVTQTALDADGRARNLRDAFAAGRGAALAGQRLVLVDDVFTTGATLDACAKVLRAAGAERITVATVARGV